MLSASLSSIFLEIFARFLALKSGLMAKVYKGLAEAA
jgi:hypothetical protein